MSRAGQSVSCTFSGNANDVLDYTMTVTSGTLSPFLQLFNSAGKLIASKANRNGNGSCAGGAVVDMNSVGLPAADTYTLTVSDCAGTNAGDYDLYSQRVSSPVGAASLPFGTVQSGTITLAAQDNTYIFNANANDFVDFTMTTSGISPRIRVYDPTGKLVIDTANRFANGACPGGMAWEADGIKLPTAGTYVVLLGDCGDVNTGTYDIYLQRTENAFGAKALAFGKIVMGSITEASQSNTYPFHASAKDRVDFTMTITSV